MDISWLVCLWRCCCCCCCWAVFVALASESMVLDAKSSNCAAFWLPSCLRAGMTAGICWIFPISSSMSSLLRPSSLCCSAILMPLEGKTEDDGSLWPTACCGNGCGGILSSSIIKTSSSNWGDGSCCCCCCCWEVLLLLMECCRARVAGNKWEADWPLKGGSWWDPLRTAPVREPVLLGRRAVPASEARVACSGVAEREGVAKEGVAAWLVLLRLSVRAPIQMQTKGTL